MPIEELERLLAMVGAFEPLPRRELRRLASGASLERLGAGEKMAVDPREHARRVIVLLVGRAEVHDSGPREGRALTLSVAEAGTVVGVAGLSGRARGLRVGALLPSGVGRAVGPGGGAPGRGGCGGLLGGDSDTLRP